MPIADRWFPGAESGVSPLLLIGGAVALAVAAVLLLVMSRQRSDAIAMQPLRTEAPALSTTARRRSGLAWPVAIVLAALLVAAGIVVRPLAPIQSSARASLETRVADLTMRALVPNSPLACLEAAGSSAIEAACEKILFSSPETLAAAAAYIDAKLSVFIEGSEAGRPAKAGDAFERLRRTIEADRYGLVAHVLATRGCDADNCPTLKLLRDSTQVSNNLKERAFDANVALRAGAWGGDGAPVVSVPAAAAPSLASVPAAPTPSSPSKFEFPSSASIPPVSIMSEEPVTPPAPKAADKAPEPPATRAAAPRRQSARDGARETTSQSVGAPVQIVPSHDAPAPVGTLANPGPSR